MNTHIIIDDYALEDRYVRERGRVFLTGTQALVRILINQSRRDRAAGLDTAGFVSGYRGSPLGGIDLELWRVEKVVAASYITFLPAVNEELAATAVLGSQQVESNPDRIVQGVFSLWYGKGPGVDRACDALKHGNAYGSSPHGGVLVVAGDDHGCVSSSMPHQSDLAFIGCDIPVLCPAGIEDYLAFGEYGYALSRYSGMWVGFKAVSEMVESGCSVELPEPRAFALPDSVVPPTGLHYRWPDLPGPQIEERMEAKKQAVYAFAKANPIDRRLYNIPEATYGIVTTGKAHLDLMEALRLLGLDEAACRSIGINIYKVGLVWPLAYHDVMVFVEGKREILVVEEKRGIVESQLKERVYDHAGPKPDRVVGKYDETGARMIPWIGELSPRLLAAVLARRLDALFPHLGLLKCFDALEAKPSGVIAVPGATRTPYFCSGCPHNTSTRVPQGSKALAGIGCHFMASWMDRDTTSLIQMGGEGVNWVASSLFTGRKHIFQNLGEGTYYHSGSLAIRQAIAAKTNITYKVLFNDAVAMTGGQPVDGPVSVQAIAHAVQAEGVARIALVSDDPDKFAAADFPVAVTFHPRQDLDTVQRELRDIHGVTILIYEQTCATEKRRRRKRETLPQPAQVVVINDLVCEGCGDCSIESNCLSVEPKETPFGRKRRINASTCNKDMTCIGGFCPSFVTVEGGRRRKHDAADIDAWARAEGLPQHTATSLDRPFNILVTGVGGTGVVTVGALISMAGHLEGRGVSVLDFTGFAQKFGPVLSFVRIGSTPADLNQVRIDQGAADALIGCDLVVSTAPKASGSYRLGTLAVVNTAEMPTGDVVRFRDTDLAMGTRMAKLEQVVGRGNLASVDANATAEALLGDTVFANVLMLGLAWQRGLVPLSLDALDRAITLNGVAIAKNRQAFAWGRLIGADPAFVTNILGAEPHRSETLDDVVGRRVAFLTEYQNAAYAERYRARMAMVRAAEKPLGSEALTDAVARALFKLMAYKDEYEVARLHMETEFLEELSRDYEGKLKITYYMAPPLLSREIDARGRPRKRAFGTWLQRPMRVLARLRVLRGTPLDLFGYTAERRMERSLIGWYEDIVDWLVSGLDPDRLPQAVAIAQAPMEIRGYGPVKADAAAKVRAEVCRLSSIYREDPRWTKSSNEGLKAH